MSILLARLLPEPGPTYICDICDSQLVAPNLLLQCGQCLNCVCPDCYKGGTCLACWDGGQIDDSFGQACVPDRDSCKVSPIRHTVYGLLTTLAITLLAIRLLSWILN